MTARLKKMVKKILVHPEIRVDIFMIVKPSAHLKAMKACFASAFCPPPPSNRLSPP
jgi:hypothetical protein